MTPEHAELFRVMAQDALGGINQLISTLRDLDERGLILVPAAFAEDSLGALLETFMLPNKAAEKLIKEFNAPLGTFASRIQAVCALGLVTKEQFEDLEHRRKIRNEFSHTWKPISFEIEPIASHIRAINHSPADDDFPDTPIAKVRTPLSFLLVELRVMTDQIARKCRRLSVIGTRLVSGVLGTVDEQLTRAWAALQGIAAEMPDAKGERGCVPRG